MSSLPPRHRGGQPGNQNARKHGFYSRSLTPTDIQDLADTADPSHLDDEISVMRVLLRDLLTRTPEAQNLLQTCELVRAAALLASSITRLVKTQQVINTLPGNAIADRFFAALSEISSEVLTELENAPTPPPGPQPTPNLTPSPQ
jgi:hypothetical protein